MRQQKFLFLRRCRSPSPVQVEYLDLLDTEILISIQSNGTFRRFGLNHHRQRSQVYQISDGRIREITLRLCR